MFIEAKEERAFRNVGTLSFSAFVCTSDYSLDETLQVKLQLTTDFNTFFFKALENPWRLQ